MWFGIIFCTISLVNAAPPFDNTQEIIIGGDLTDIVKVPYQISLQMYDGFHICSGSIIGSRYIVTAAHCTNGKTADILSIRAGSSQYTSGGQFRKVKTVIQHPQYNNKTQDFDIAILELAQNLVFVNGVQPVKLPLLNQKVPVGTKALVSGWGLDKESNKLGTTNLYSVELTLISRDDCQAYLTPKYFVTGMMFCTLKKNNSCQGDSGGPLVVKGELFGIVSWGIGCASPTTPGVFASVPALREYIKEHTGL